ncbi:MAG: hypothetical protein J7J38_00175 [Candidatus Aenigmarchaeota archaeon]|nr:hypothetical protein [Candidatus Aenigmarchaeota archaeon]
MADTKIVAGIFIALLVVIAGFVSTLLNDIGGDVFNTGNFLDKMRGKISHIFFAKPSVGDAKFFLQIDDKRLSISPVEPVDIYIEPSESFSVDTDGLVLNDIDDDVKIVGFKGDIKFGERLSLKGRFNEMHLKGMNITQKLGKMRIDNLSANDVEIENVIVNEIKTSNVTGSLTLPDLKIDINSKPITISGFSGNVTISTNLEFEGYYGKIRIGDEVIAS